MAPDRPRRDLRALHEERDSRTDELFEALRTEQDRDDGDGVHAARIIEEIVQFYLPLSDGMARRYLHRGIDGEDLVQVARLALVKAIKRYDVDAGGSFAGFAVPTISGELKRYFRDHGWMVRPSRRVQELRIVVRGRRQRLEQELGHTASRAELAEDLGVTRQDLDEAESNDFSFRPLSIDAPTQTGEEPSLSGTVAVPDQDLEHVCDHVALYHALGGLDERARHVLRLRFVEGQTQRSIAEELGASQMQVSRLLSRALHDLRDCMEGGEDATRAG